MSFDIFSDGDRYYHYSSDKYLSNKMIELKSEGEKNNILDEENKKNEENKNNEEKENNEKNEINEVYKNNEENENNEENGIEEEYEKNEENEINEENGNNEENVINEENEIYEENEFNEEIAINEENEKNEEKESINKSNYDAIVFCNSIKKLYKNGWDYLFQDKFLKRLKDKNKFCPICIIGGQNKGKTFILNLLINNKIISNNEINEEGLNCKFINVNFSSDEINENKKSNEKFLVFKNKGRLRPLLKDKVDQEIKNNLDDEVLKRKYFLSYIKDLKLTEEFMNNLLIKNSNIIIFVVNELSLEEQTFLYELKNNDCFQQLFIIHNLFNFEYIDEMEYYINNTIIGSTNFELTKEYFQIEDEEENFEQPYYFVDEHLEN